MSSLLNYLSRTCFIQLETQRKVLQNTCLYFLMSILPQGTITRPILLILKDNKTKLLECCKIKRFSKISFHRYTEEQTRNLVRKPIILPPASPDETNGDSEFQVASSTAESMEQEKCWLYQQFSASVTPSVQRVVEFAKRVPGFCDLGQDDQLILIKLGFFEVWLSHAARLTSNTSMVFDDGTVFSRQQLDIMFDVSIEKL